MIRRILLCSLFALAFAGCASLPQSDPPQITVAGIEPLQGEGLEVRMLVKLRVQNPNDAPIDYNGVYVRLDVQQKTFATGVSDAKGSVPRFGESVVEVPVTVSAFRIARQVIGAMGSASEGKMPNKVRYDLSGKFSGTGFRSVRFGAKGEFALPGAANAGAAEGTRTGGV